MYKIKMYKMYKMYKIKYKKRIMKKNLNFQQSIQQVVVHLMNMKTVFMMKYPILMEKMTEIK